MRGIKERDGVINGAEEANAQSLELRRKGRRIRRFIVKFVTRFCIQVLRLRL
jgi:hypothetical protein